MSADPTEVKAARANVNRLYRIAKRSILSTTTLVKDIVDEQSAGQFASASTIHSLEQELSLVGDNFQEVYVAMNTLLAWDLLPGDSTAVEADLQTLVGLQRTLGGLARTATKTSPAAAPPPSVAPATFRIQSSLKPKQLLVDSTPSEVKVWKMAFMAYYDNSNMDQLPVPKQRNYLNSCLGPQLSLESEADDQVKLFGPPPLIFSALDEYFKHLHPIFNRRSASLASRPANPVRISSAPSRGASTTPRWPR